MHFYFDGVIIKASAKENPIDDRKRKNKKIMPNLQRFIMMVRKRGNG
ncbi:hypothetical protein [Ruminococcus bromii]